MEVTDDHEEHVHIRWQSFGVVPGLSEADFMARQRYLQLTRRSGAQYSMLSLGSFQDASKRRPSTSIDVSHFIKEQRKILKTVRSQPWPMHIKINAVRHYKAAISRYTTLLDKFDTVKDTTMQVKSKVNRFYIGLLKTLTIWNSIIKRIEGKFGSSVASYFTFLRWLCALNLFLSLILIFFVILPQAFSGHGLKVPQEIKQNSSEVSFLFDGQGYILQYSVLFYGYYDSGQNEPYMPPPVNPDPYIGWRYKLPLAYLLMIPLIFGISIVAILMSIAEKYKLIQQADATDPYPFSRRVFTGWDYAVTYANTACRKAAHIATELKEIVADVVSDEQKVLSMKIFAIRILSNGTIIFLLCLSSVAIYVAVENVEKGGNYNFKTALQQGISGLWAFILSFQVQLVIVGRNVTMRGVFLLVAVIERHHPRTALKLMLVRMFCLYVSSLYVLIIALLTISDDCADDVSGEVCCWETIVGQEMYKLSWTQIGAEILSIFFIDGTVWIVTLCGPQKVKKYVECLEFDIAHHVLQSIYSQALVWLGMLFCPFLPTINFFKCVVLFYIKLFGIMLFNRPPKAMFKISTTNNFYMGMLLLMLFLSLFPVGYAVLEIIPSTECGPFRGQTKMMDVIINEIHTWPDIVQDAIQYIQTSAVIVPLIILLCIIIYYYGALSHVLKELNKDLQVQLILERREVRARIAERLPHNDILPVHSEKFLDTQTRDFSLEHMDDSLSITSFDTYTKYEPKVLAQNIFDDAKHPEDNNLSMYPMISHTDDDDDDDDDDKVIKKHVTFNTKLVSANTDSAVINNKKMNASAATPPQDSDESSDDVVEESSSEDERSLENCKRDATSSSSNTSSNSRNIAVDSMADSAVDSEQVVIGPSHLVENKNSFNIVSRVANYSSSSSSSDEGEDAWDDSLLAPVKPKPALGIMNKEDVEKNLEKRKALHAKFQEFLSAPLPLPSSSDRHPFGSRGKRGNRRGAHGIGRYAAIGRGKHSPVTSGWSDDHGNQTRSNVHHRKTLLSSQRQFPQQHFPQQQFPQQQFPHTQQQFPQQQQQQQYSQQQQQFPQQNFPQRQLPQRQFSQQQLFQQRFPAQQQFPQQQFPRQQFPGQQLSLSKQDQPWQHNHSPKLRQLFTNKSPIKSTQQIPDTTSAPATMTTNTSTNITSIDQLDEQGMKNEYEWQKWMIERSVKKALEGLTDELVSDFNSQLKKILSDSSAITLNKFPSGKGAVWVIARSVCCFAVDKPAQCSKAVIALQEIHKTCTDEMVRLFPEVLQSCSEQVLKELSATNTQCGSYCNLVCSLHRSTAKDNTSLQVLMDTSLGQLLKFWTEYALNEKSSELECEGCVNLIVAIFTDILPHLTACNRPLLDRCGKMVRSLILSFIPRKPRENLLDFYMIIMRNRTDTVAVTSSLSSLSLDKTADQTGMSDSGVFNPDKLNRPIVKPNQSSAMPDQSLIKIDQSSVNSDQSMAKPDQFSTAPNQSMVKIDQSSSKVDQTLVEPDQTLVEPDHSLASTVKPDHSIVPDQSSAELNQSKEPQQALISPDHFSVKPDQPVDQVSQVTVTTSDTPSHSTVVTATNSHERDVVSPMTSTMVAQAPPIHDAYCNVAAMLSALNLSYLLENFKAAIIQDNVLTCDPSGLKEAMKEAGIPSGAVLSILHYLSKTDVNAGRVQFPSQASCYQYPVHYPTAAAYGIQPSHQATYLQQPQPHPLAAATAQFNSVSHSHQMCTVPACGHSHQMYTVPASQQVVSPVGVPSPTHPFLQSASL